MTTTTATAKKTLPAWLILSDSSATILLAKPAEFNGVKVDRVTLREPTIRDLRTAEKVHPNDKEAQEFHLFASLAECSPDDFEGLTLRNYNRIQGGYFRLVREDEDAA
ncbi:phage tail assembly protein [Azotobacter chroococcum]|uniref:Phage tail assembly protein n=1 Tax=Azotobacter chroococcum TaxID=353 RepID=A0AA43Z7K1_9GAMM|nr:phage tail assembly protein [Azotobacter chroococcum]NHN77686.1 phage tail assembly protein [Azotobacter chroococcum]